MIDWQPLLRRRRRPLRLSAPALVALALAVIALAQAVTRLT